MFCWRDDEPSSARLLTLVGMHPIGIEQIILEDGTVLGEKEVWSNVRS